MIFDTLCAIAENQLPTLVPLLKRAKLFDFPHAPHEILPKSFPPDEAAFYRENFFLPFPVICVEDKASAVVMWDDVEDAKGSRVTRRFIECTPLAANAEAYEDGNEYRQELA